MTQANTGLQISDIGQQITNLLGGATRALETVGPFIPGLNNIIGSPAFQQARAQTEGRRMSAALEAVRPELGNAPTTAGMVQLPGRPTGTPVTTANIAQQAISERTAAFQALQELGGEQRAELSRFRSGLEGLSQRIGGLDAELRSMAPQVRADFNAAIDRVDALRQRNNANLRLAFTTAGGLLSEVRGDIASVREDFINDVTDRAAAMADGIRAGSRAAYGEHVNALAAAGGVSSEERIALAALYERDAARQVASSAATLHESAMQLRSQMETTLNANLTSAVTSLGQQLTGAIVSVIDADRAATQIAADLTNQRTIALQNIMNTRQQLLEFGRAVAIDGGAAMFDMVTQIVHPVAVFSDILQNMFDGAWDAVSFNNNVEIQRMNVEAFIQQPLNQAFIDAIGMSQRNYEFEQQMELQEEALSRSTWNAVISGGSQVAAAAMPESWTLSQGAPSSAGVSRGMRF